MATQLVTPNLDPVIYQPDGRGGVYALNSWAGWCLAYVQTAFGTGWAGARAWHAWEAAKGKHANRNFPKNVYFPIWFSHWGTYGGVYGNFGHTAIAYVNSNGSISIWSSPMSNKPYADVFSSIEEVERIFNSKYVGWTEDIGGVDVISLRNVEVEAKDMETIKSMYLRTVGRAATQANLKQMLYEAGMNGWDSVFNKLSGSDEGQSWWYRSSPERVKALERGIDDRDKKIADLEKALTNEKGKPPVEIIKEVEKIIEKEVEVIKEVPTSVNEQEVVTSWLLKLWNGLFK